MVLTASGIVSLYSPELFTTYYIIIIIIIIENLKKN